MCRMCVRVLQMISGKTVLACRIMRLYTHAHVCYIMQSCVGMQSQQSKLQALKISMDNYNQTAYLPDSALHPGSVVSDYLEANGWSQRELSMRKGITLQVISAICNCKSPITTATATALENVFQRPAHFWLGLQQQYNDAVPDCGGRQQRIEAIR